MVFYLAAAFFFLPPLFVGGGMVRDASARESVKEGAALSCPFFSPPLVADFFWDKEAESVVGNSARLTAAPFFFFPFIEGSPRLDLTIRGGMITEEDQAGTNKEPRKGSVCTDIPRKNKKNRHTNPKRI